ncbi:glycosyl hydrolase [Erwinia sp. E602]|uniref:beta-glucosidase family protein n=1 Tax=Erwinia sp. E602 TaxID=2675378 RepID=UPI001BABCCE6|nr:glycoside hydrolase family 3 C-terminal domain-containing protein [Erwinia sp. E602]QUG74387.1 glycosyl hydrolase [Erwinia sp. E602]
MAKNIDKKRVINDASIEEKVSLLCGKGLWRMGQIPRFATPDVVMTDGTYGVRYSESQIDQGEGLSCREFFEVVAQRPVGSEPQRGAEASAQQGNDPGLQLFGTSKPATCFPNGASVACSWDTELMRKMGVALAEECLEMGVSILLGPGINIRRTPLAGRAYEYYSEDPLLSGELAAALIDGLQSQGVGACLKHFACNNSEIRRTQMDSVVDERALREIYLAGFRRAIEKSDPWMVMTSYNLLNGVQTSANPWLTHQVLRDEWQYQGIVVSDWYAVKHRPASLQAGNDLSMPETQTDKTELAAAVASGQVPLSQLDLSVNRALDLLEKAEQNKRPGFKADFEQHHKLAQQIAAESLVLLKNEGQILPLNAARHKKIAVIGHPATRPVIQGNGCATTHPWKLNTPLDEIMQLAGDFDVSWAPGTASNDSSDASALRTATEAAASADLAILFVSTPIGEDGENSDREHLSIQPQHEELLNAIARVQPELVVVIANSESVVMPWLAKARAVIELFFAGQGMGKAVAQVLLGEANPCGKLTVTVPNTLEETPAFLTYPGDNNRQYYSEGLYVGYRYYDRRKIEPLFPFGFGLSYTTFSYEEIALSTTRLRPDETLTVSVTLKNSGDRDGKEIVQLYVAPPHGRLARPEQELKGFAKLEIAAGERRTASIELAARDLEIWDPASEQWRIEPGVYRLLAGKSSRDIALVATLTVMADRLPAPLREDSSLTDLLEHPAAFERVCQLFSRKSGRSLHEARKTLELNAPDLFTSVFISMATIFELDISRDELNEVING